MTLFELAAKLTLDTTEYEASLREAKQMAENAGDSLDASMKATDTASTWTIAKGVAYGTAAYHTISDLATAVWDAGKDLVNTSAEIKAENAQFAATMGDMAAVANRAFSRISADTNILDTRLRRVGVMGFSQFTAAGMDAVEAMDAMNTYTQLAADGAAYMDMSLEEVGERIRSFVRGNTEAGEAIRLFTSMTDRENRAMEKFGLSWKELTEAQRQFIFLDTAKDIYDQIGATGQAARESHEWANTIGNLQEAWTQAKAIIGGPLMEKLIPSLERLTTWLNTNPEKLEAIGNVLGNLGAVTFDGIISLLTLVADRGSEIFQFIDKLNKLWGGGQVSKGQTFGDEKAWLAAEDWRQAAQAHDTTGTALTLAAQLKAWKELQSVMGAEQAQTFATAFNEYLQDNKLTYEAEVPAEWFSGTKEKLQEDLEKMDLTAPVSLQPRLGAFATVAIGSAMSAANSVLASLPGHAEGLDYVPYDNYAARLHEGEAVLTREEAQEWRNSPADNGEILAMLRQLNENITALRGMKIVLNGHEVGEAVTETVSRNIAQNAQTGRYA